MQQMICPKCHGAMRAYERSGVTLEQCTECRGIFLDRGELERLSEAETAYHGGAQQHSGQQSHQPPQPQPPQAYQQQHSGSYGHDSHGHDSYSYGGHKYKKKHKNFLEELFD